MDSRSFRRLAWALPVLVFAFAVAMVPRLAAGPAVAAPAIDPAPFPPGFDYPQTAQTVLGWVRGRSGQSMRKHGWSVFAGLNQKTADGSFVWRTWYTSTQAFPWQYARSGTDPNRPSMMSRRNVHQAEGVGGDPNLSVPGDPVYPLPDRVKGRYSGCVAGTGLIDGPTFQSNGDIMVAGVIYNESAFQWIQNERLYDARVLTSQLSPNRQAPPTVIGEFPHEAIVLKPMWWPVKGTGTTALPIWDSPPPSADGSSGDGLQGARYSGFEVQSLWKRAVAITAGSPGGTATVTYLNGVLDANGKRQLGPITYQDAPVVPLERFYHLTFSGADLAVMDRCDRALLDASAMWNYGRPFAAGDSLALIAMHIMTKEKPGWTFQSVWWHDQALACSTNPSSCNGTSSRPASYGSNRPAQLPGDTTWQNYFMVTTYGEEQVPGNANAWPPGAANQAGKWPVAYNPYIELAATHPIATNCMNCHHRAAWPARPASGSTAGRHSSYLAGGANVPDTQDTFTRTNPIFNGLLELDSMWAVSDRAHNPPR